MGMQIDEAWRDKSSAHVAAFGRFGWFDIVSDRGDAPARKRDVGYPVKVLRGIDDMAAFENEVVGHWSNYPLFEYASVAPLYARLRSWKADRGAQSPSGSLALPSAFISSYLMRRMRACASRGLQYAVAAASKSITASSA